MSLSRITSIVLYLVMGVSAVLLIWFYAGPVVTGTEGTSMEEPTITDTILGWSAVLFIIAAAAAIIFSIINIFLNPESAKKTLLGLVVAAVIVLIAWFLASDQVLQITAYDGPDNVPSRLKMAGTGLYTVYILAGIALLAILFSEVSKYFK